jgi:hypothetical protein
MYKDIDKDIIAGKFPHNTFTLPREEHLDGDLFCIVDQDRIAMVFAWSDGLKRWIRTDETLEISSY